jgi:hypothetical protein
VEHTLVSVTAAFVYCYGKEPGSKAAFAAEFLEAEERGEKRILRDVLDVSGPAEQPICQHRDFGGVSLDDSVKGRFIASVELFDQPFVINALGHGYYIRAAKRRKLTKKQRKSTADKGVLGWQGHCIRGEELECNLRSGGAPIFTERLGETRNIGTA